MTHFSLIDYVLFGGYLVASVLVGLLFVKEQRTVKDYFLAGKSMGSMIVGLSVIAAMFSGISYLATPAEIYKHGFTFAWGMLSFFIITPFVTLVMLPLFYQSRFFTAYQYLEDRFSRQVRVLASTLFVLRVLLWLAAATYAPAIALQQATGMSLEFTILCTGLLTTFYTTLGGMKAVIWTDMLQLGVLFGGQVMIVFIALGKFPNGASEVYHLALDAGRFDLSFSWDPTVRMTFWTAIIAAPFLNLIQLGTDQVSVQRYLTAKSLKEAKRGLWIKLWLFMPIGALFYVTGLILWAFYQKQPDPITAGHIASVDQILPYFVVHELPRGFAGILIAAIYAASMSTVSAGLNSLSSCTLMDLGKGATSGTVAQEETQLRKAQALTISYGILVTALAFLVGKMGSLVESVNQIIGLVGGPLLGLFLLGMLVPRTNTLGAMTGVLTGFVSLIFLYAAKSNVSFMWYAMFGCIITMVVGYLVSLLMPPPPDSKLDDLVWQRRPTNENR
jgi:sodium-coupled monocarboxylate transporter 8/12